MKGINEVFPVCCCFLGLALELHSQPALDQSFTGGSDLAFNINICCPNAAQTYTAGTNGFLVGVSLDVRAFSTSYPLQISICEVTNGVPSPVLLAETVISRSDAPLDYVASIPGLVKQQTGKQYAIVVNYPGAPRGMGNGLWTGSTGQSYGGGKCFASSDGLSWSGFTGDLHFKTFVNSQAPYEAIARLATGQARGIVGVGVKDDYAYVLDIAGWLYPYNTADFSQRTNFSTVYPLNAGVRITTRDAVSFWGPLGVGRHLYAWDTLGGGIVVVDLGNANNPVAARVIPTAAQVYNCIKASNILIAGENGSLELFSLQDAAKPASFLTVPLGAQALSMAVYGNNLYVAAGVGSPRLFVLDFSSPTNTQVVTTNALSALPYHMTMIGSSLVCCSDQGVHLLNCLWQPLSPYTAATNLFDPGRVCARDGDNLVVNGAAMMVRPNALTLYQEFGAHDGTTPLGLPYTSATQVRDNSTYVLLARTEDVLVMRRSNNTRLRTYPVGNTLVMLDFPTEYGSVYQVEWTASLLSTNWQNLANSFVGDGDFVQSLDAVEAGSQRFYRLRKSN